MIYLLIFLFLVTVVVAQSDALNVAKMDEIAAEADDLVRDFKDSDRRLTSKIRTRLVILLLRLIPADIEVNRSEDPVLREKFDNIVLLLEKKMRINYSAIKERISNIVTRLIAPTLVPFAMMQAPSQEEIQQALLAFETKPAYRDIQYPPPSSTRLTTDLQYLASNQQTRPSRTYSSQYLSAIPQRTYQPQLNYLSVSQYPQEYQYSGASPTQYYGASTSRQYYWPNYNSYQPVVQQQYSPQYYWQQPVQPIQPVQQRQPYFYDYSTGNTYYDQNTVFAKYRI